MISLLEDVKSQPAAIHDLKFTFETNLHEQLKKMGYAEDSTNKGIKIDFPSFDSNIVVKGFVYRTKIQLDLGCSYKPFVYDLSGTLNLCSILGQIQLYLRLISHHDTRIPSISSWIITHYHFAKDGSQTYSGKSFHITFDDAFHGMSRFYSKRYPDGKTLSRFENIITPKIRLEQEITKMLNS
ncbi:MAG: hypothetical protein ACW9W3_01100 [Candidatus Nitrosopumilus sp. bin_68KS]